MGFEKGLTEKKEVETKTRQFGVRFVRTRGEK